MALDSIREINEVNEMERKCPHCGKVLPCSLPPFPGASETCPHCGKTIRG